MSDREGDDQPDSMDELPPRLFARPGRHGELVRRYLRQPHRGSEEQAWQRLESASEGTAWSGRRPRRAPAVRVFAFVGAASLAVTAFLVFRTPVAQLPRPSASAERRAPSGRAVNEPLGDVPAGPREGLVLGPDAQTLGPGRWAIQGEASGELAPGGLARAELGVGGAPTVTLVSGQVSLSVAHKDRPALFRVASPPYVFTVLGTVFRVERGPTEVKLVVDEGRVAVSRAGRELTTVTGGGTWSGLLGPGGVSRKENPHVAATQASASPGDTRAAVEVPRTCTPNLPSQERLSCWRRQAAGNGLGAETALYEIGKLTRDELHEPAAALAAFEDLRRRFPSGALRVETDLSIVELLARSGRYHEALSESAALLARGGSDEREADLHLLRGNLYREALVDLPHAADEYRLAADRATRGPTADEAAFLYAVTIEALGRRDDATELYRRYLSRTHPSHERDARIRLDKLLQISDARHP